MNFQFRTKIFMAIALVLIMAMTAMFLASTATVQQPLVQYIDSELERVYRHLERWQSERIQLLITQGLLISEKPDLWNSVYSLTIDPTQLAAEVDETVMADRTPEAIRRDALQTVEDTLNTIRGTYQELIDPAFILIIDTNGEILVSQGDGPSEGQNVSQYSFWQLINQTHRTRTAKFIYNDVLYQVTLVPIKLADERVGYVSLGFAMDAATIGIELTSDPAAKSTQSAGIRDIYVLFLSQDKKVLASTVPPDMAVDFHKKLVSQIPDKLESLETVMQSSNYPIRFEYRSEDITGQYWPIQDEFTSQTIGYEVVVTSKTKALAFLKELRIDFLVISLIALLLSGIVGYFVSKSVTRPVDQLVFAAEQLTAGQLDHQVEYKVRDEMGVLAEAFEHMRKSLLRRLQELAELNASLELKVQERTTELRQAMENLKQAESHLVLSEKMVALGQLVAGIAHEINNPLNYIKNGIKPLKLAVSDLKEIIDAYDQCELDAADRKKIEQYKAELDLESILNDVEDLSSAIQEGAERTLQIVTDLRTFSRKDETNFKEADIHEGIESSLNILRHEIRDRVEIVREYGKIPLIQCNLGQLNQVFLNLLNNAQQAISGNGRIIIRTDQIGEEVLVSVRDNGLGISQENLQKIFEPFFTTKEVGRGTGLGLSISYGIIQRHGGRIEVSSVMGEGTEFRLYLPIRAPRRETPEEENTLLFATPSVD